MKKFKVYLLLHGLMLLFSFSPVFSKLAGTYPLLSLPFLFFYGLVIVILGLYAILWQQVIKRLPLTTAYANKAVTVVWGMIWGVVIFGEQLTPLKIAGGLVVIAGVLLYASADRTPKANKGGEQNG